MERTHGDRISKFGVRDSGGGTAPRRIVLGMTGASGVGYGIRLLELLCKANHKIDVVLSPAWFRVVEHELGLKRGDRDLYEFLDVCFRRLHANYYGDNPVASVSVDRIHDAADFAAPIASGSYRTDAMVVAPCTTGTLGCIASGVHRHLIHRAAEVHLKERRRLILLVRESPLSLIQLENMKRIVRAGGIIQSATPHFYGETATVGDLIDSVVRRTLDLLDAGQRRSNTDGLSPGDALSRDRQNEQFIDLGVAQGKERGR